MVYKKYQYSGNQTRLNDGLNGILGGNKTETFLCAFKKAVMILV